MEMDRTVIQDRSACRYHIGVKDAFGAVAPLCGVQLATTLCIVRRETKAKEEAYLCSACARRMIGVR